MNYAKWISDTEIQIPVPADYLEDGITLKTPEDWSEYEPSDMPTDGTVFKSYRAKYVLMSDEPLSTVRRIIQVWQPVYWEPEGRVAKLSGSELVFPQTNERGPGGQLVFNYHKLPNSRKIRDGWVLVEETPYPDDGKSYCETGTLIDDAVLGHKIKIVWEETTPVPEPAFDISKLKLGREFRALGQEVAFEAYLAANPDIKRDWDRAVTLMSDDPLVVAAREAFKTSLGLTDAQIQALLYRCRSDI